MSISLFKSPSKILAAGFLMLSFGLAGCVDVNMDVTVLGEDSVQAKTIISMDRNMYDMSQAQGQAGFCDEGTVELSEKSATCTSLMSGDFAKMNAISPAGEPQPNISLISAGMVRVTFPTGAITKDFGPDSDEMGEEEKQMMQAMFEGHSLKLTVSGGHITETNMTLAPDGNSAFLDVSLVDLIAGEASLPDEAFAIVKLP